MIVCHCNVLSCKDIKSSVQKLTAEGISVVTPGGVFKCCGKRPQCGGCMNNVTSVITSELERLAHT